MVEYDPVEDGNAESDIDYIKPTKYMLGSLEEDGHTHIFYLRDHLPIATTVRSGEGPLHAHSIIEGPDHTVIAVEEIGHTHTTLVVKDAGGYAVRTLHV